MNRFEGGMSLPREETLQFNKRAINVLSTEMTYTLIRLLGSSPDGLLFLPY